MKKPKPFANKKALTFIALPYHNRILFPVMRALEDQGMCVQYSTAAAEAGFEITLNEVGLSYLHPLDYLHPYGEICGNINSAYQEIAREWQTRLLKSEVLAYVPIVITDKILRSAVENLYCFTSMIETEKPDVVFALHEINSWGKMLGYICNKKGIPFVTFQEGLCYAAPPLYRLSTEYSTACILWGNAAREVLLQADCDPTRICTLGNIDLWDAVQQSAIPEKIAETRRELGAEEGQKVILFLMAYAPYLHFEAPLFVRWLWDHRDAITVWKWHPLTTKETIGTAMKTLHTLPSIKNIDGAGANTYDLIAAADACVVVGNSTTAIEALVFSKPLVEVPLPNQTYSFATKGAADSASTLEEAVEFAYQSTTCEPSAERKEHVERFLDNHFSFWDGKTVERVVNLVQEVLVGK